MRQTFFVAKKVGEELGRSQILLGKMPPSQIVPYNASVRKLTPTELGLIFLVPGLLVAVTTSFSGAAVGFSTFSILFGVVMILIGRFAPSSKTN